VENQVDVTTPAAGQYEPAPPDYPNYYVGPMLGVSAGQQYEFQVTALQCPPAASGESTASPVRKWPCTLAAGAAGTMAAPGAFDGNGSAGTPWLFASDATVSVSGLTASAVTSVTFRRYDAAGSFIPGSEAVDNAAPYTYSWTIAQGQTEGVTATIQDTSGCVGQVQGFVQDEDQGCCLEPVTLDPSALVFSAGNPYVDIYLRNICSGNLTMNSITVSWDESITGNAGKLQSVSFPLTAGGFGTVSLGGSISPPETVSAPSGTKVVTSTDTNYRIRLTFGKNLSQQPITAFSATYLNNAVQATCPVISTPTP
jgi:hypothetical protein